MAELTISVTELRNHFDQYLQRVKSGEVFIITKYGKPLAHFAPAQDVSEEEKNALSGSKEE
jgi:prevent-host-death family protein